jgi:hypothetical protein
MNEAQGLAKMAMTHSDLVRERKMAMANLEMADGIAATGVRTI